jgi:hypothetical protein
MSADTADLTIQDVFAVLAPLNLDNRLSSWRLQRIVPTTSSLRAPPCSLVLYAAHDASPTVTMAVRLSSYFCKRCRDAKGAFAAAVGVA